MGEDQNQLIHSFQILQFYGWWEFSVCLFAACSLLAIWYHIGKRQSDFGQVWLAISVLCWSLSGGFEIYFSWVGAQKLSMGQPIQDQYYVYWSGTRSILSLFNSLFILLALPWFRYIPTRLQSIIQSKYWILIVGLPFLFCLFPTLTKIFTGSSQGLISELDVYYSVLTLIFLGIVMYSSFERRRLPLLAWLALICIAITFIAQLFKLFYADINEILLSAIFKTNLIMIFFALALSWVKELSENIHEEVENISFTLQNIPYEGDRWKKMMRLQLGKKNYNIPLSESNFALMALFENKRNQDIEGWLEIKPKNNTRDGKLYDIQDYNQIKRLVHAILDGMYGKGNWSPKVHGNKLKDQLFEKSDKFPRLIRLKSLPIA